MLACEQLEPGSVSVWGGGDEGVCFFGQLIALRIKERGLRRRDCRWGGVRDLVRPGRIKSPVYARRPTPSLSIGR